MASKDPTSNKPKLPKVCRVSQQSITRQAVTEGEGCGRTKLSETNLMDSMRVRVLVFSLVEWDRGYKLLSQTGGWAELSLTDRVRGHHVESAQGRPATPLHQKERAEAVASWARCSSRACPLGGGPRVDPPHAGERPGIRLMFPWISWRRCREGGLGFYRLDDLLYDFKFYWSGCHESSNNAYYS